MSKSTRGIRTAGVASLAVTLSMGVAAPAFAVDDFAFERLGGDDRYATAALVADEYGAKPDAIVANGQPGKYADALSSNYLAGAEDAPILLTRLKGLPPETLAELDDMNAQNVWVVGGSAAVPQSQVAQLEDAGYNVVRVAGDDRFETNAEVLAEGGNSAGGVGLIATGVNFPDALAAGPFAYQGHSLGLTKTNSLPDAVGDALEADGVTSVLIFGGTGAVGAGVVEDLADRGITVAARFAGSDRSETSELAAEWALDNINFVDTHVGVASGYPKGFGADALAGGPLEGSENSPMLITRSVDNPDDVLDYLENHCETLEDGHLFGGSAAISAAAEAAMEAAAQCDDATPGDNPFGANSSTGAPELQAVNISSTDPTVVRYVFDETIPGQALNFFGTAPNRTYQDFRLYLNNSDGSATTAVFPREARVEGNTVVTRFAIADQVKAAVRAGVRYGAVEDAEGIANIEGEMPLAPTVTTTTVAPYKPQLIDVRNFRLADVIIGGNQEVLVDYVFDSNPNAVGLDGTDFHLVGSNSQDYPGQLIVPGTPRENADKSWTVTVQFASELTEVPESQLRRGYVEYPDPQAGDGNPATDDEFVILSDAYENGTGVTVDPDLVSATVTNEASATYTVRYVFDEAISDQDLQAGEFYLYDSVGDTITATTVARSAQAADAATVVIATFNATGFEPVGAFIEDRAVQATDNTASENDGWNRPDERDLTLPAPVTTTIPPGFTALPDLLAVDVEQNEVTENYSVTYLFDETCAQVNDTIEDIAFDLYDASGTQFRVTGISGATDGVAVTNDTSTDPAVTECSVTFSIDEGFAQFDNEQIAAAVTGGVEDSTSEPTDDPEDEGTAVDSVQQPSVTEGQQDVS